MSVLKKMSVNLEDDLRKYGDVELDSRILKAVVKSLTERQQEVVIAHYYEEKSVKEISKQFRISTTRVYGILREFILKLFIRTDKGSMSEDNIWLLADKGLDTRFIYAFRRGGIHTIADLRTWVNTAEGNRQHLRCIGRTAEKQVVFALSCLSES